MAIYHSRIRVFSRGRNQSAVAAAALRAGLLIVDPHTGMRYDYRNKSGIVETTIFAPDDAPPWVYDPEKLWIMAEQRERRQNSTLAREFRMALPHELNAQQHQALVVDVAHALVDRYQFVVQASIHQPENAGLNHHVHFLVTTRRIRPDGFGDKTRELDGGPIGRAEVAWTRTMMENTINAHLDDAGIEARVDHRKLSVQAQEAEARGEEIDALVLRHKSTESMGQHMPKMSDNPTTQADSDNPFEKAVAAVLGSAGTHAHTVHSISHMRVEPDYSVEISNGLNMGKTTGTNARAVVRQLRGTGREVLPKMGAEEAWNIAQELWRQRIVPLQDMPMPHTKKMVASMGDRMRGYAQHDRFAAAVRDCLRRFQRLLHVLEVPRKHKQAHRQQCDLLARAQRALAQINSEEPTAQNLVVRVRRARWVEQQHTNVEMSAIRVGAEQQKADKEHIALVTADVELLGADILAIYPVVKEDNNAMLDNTTDEEVSRL